MSNLQKPYIEPLARAALVKDIRGSITEIIRGRKRDPSTAKKKKSTKKVRNITHLTAKMIGDLYEKMSGTASEGESYTFAVGKDAYMLRRIKDLISKGHLIRKTDAKKVLEIYKKFFPKEAEKIKL